MKKLNVLDLATILQLDESLKAELKANFDKYDENLKCEILDILWNNLQELEKRLAKLKYDQFMVELEQGKRQLMTNMYDEAVKAVWRDFEDIISGKSKEKEIIESIRSQLKPLAQADDAK